MSPENQSPTTPPTRPLLIVLSGPSGAGKDALLSRMREANYPLKYITTVTTRPQRANETDKIDYHFVSEAKFQKMIDQNELLEWASVYGNWYGVPRKPIKQALDAGQDTMVKVDVQGAITIKKIMPQAIFIFLMPPSMAELRQRLQERHTESSVDLALRIKTAEDEIKHLFLFEYIVFSRSGEIEQAVTEIQAIITAEKCRVNQREINLDKQLQ